MKLLGGLLAALCIAVTSGCGGTETGNPGKSTKLGLVLRASDPNIAALGAPQGGVGVSSFWVAVESLQLSPCNQGETRSSTPRMVFDVGAAQPLALDTSDVAYCALNVTFAPSEDLPAGAPAELARGTLWLQAARSNNTRFRLLSNLTTTLSLTDAVNPNPAGLQFKRGESLLLAFDISTLLSGIPGNLQGENPLIEQSTHPDPIQNFNDNVPRAMSLHVDSNANGKLDTEEQTPIAEP